jgi:beta-lactamase regulating signal transducer with metallopeptidase domain
MILDAILHNLRPWTEQVIVVALVAALLPALIRLRHPRTQLVYCQLMLIACLLLPFLQPWRHAVVVISEDSSAAEQAPIAATAPAISDQSPVAAVSASTLPAATAPRPFWRKIPAERFWFVILAAGAFGRLCWLLAGLWKIRGYRIAATPLYPIPEAVEAAAALTHADALFCISSDVSGPVMLGMFCPVVLLPDSFTELDDEAKCGIAAHELLHVRRNDWLVTLIEELAASLLWFNPGIWWLLAETRLAREQLVDAEAVRLTSSRDSYIQALLAIARSRQPIEPIDLAPAPLFLRRRHLTQRMHSLLKDVSVSWFRLMSGYAFIGVILAVAGWLSFTAFPMAGSPHIQRIALSVPASQPALPEPSQPVPAAVTPVPPTASTATPARRSAPTLVPVPLDTEEPVRGSIRTLATVTERAAALSLLERARQNSDMHLAGTPPFRLDVTFLASGNVLYAGSGTLSETWLSGQRWTWSANFAGYSETRIGRGQVGFEEQPVPAVPMRVHMVREAVFWPVRFGPGAKLRAATALRQGKTLTCVLLNGQADPETPMRLWAEQEYCIDNASGLLDVFSPAPGTYFAYNYGNDFHGRMVPDRITASVGGFRVLDAQIVISDANPESVPVATAAYRPGITLEAGRKFLISTPSTLVTSSIQTVIVHAALSPEGAVLEEEVSASADPRLSQAALDVVRQHPFPQALTQRDAYVSVGFHPVQ